MIGIIDYGAGNLRSVRKAFDFLQVPNSLIRTAAEWRGMERLVLPGVGAFGAAVGQLRERGLFSPLREWLADDRPFLGICLGMQLLLEGSEESPDAKGFGTFPGRCRRFEHGKVPQIGWNELWPALPLPLFSGIADGTFFYFIHGFYVPPLSGPGVAAETDYHIRYPSVLARGNLTGVQFHPEKSGEAGLRLLRNWIERC